MRSYFSSLFDSYKLTARLLPSVIVALPVLIALAIPFQWFGVSIQMGTVGGALSLAVLYLSSQLVRAAGLKLEKQQWSSWGGPPSTRFVRWQDGRIASETKAIIHSAVRTRFGINLLDAAGEMDDPSLADAKITQAFLQVRELLRSEIPKEHLLNTQNAEYGFVRNLLGCRTISILISSVCFAAALTAYFVKPSDTAVYVSIVEFLILTASVMVGWLVLPQLLVHVADRYAETAWSCFLRLSTGHKRPAAKSSSKLQR